MGDCSRGLCLRWFHASYGAQNVDDVKSDKEKDFILSAIFEWPASQVLLNVSWTKVHVVITFLNQPPGCSTKLQNRAAMLLNLKHSDFKACHKVLSGAGQPKLPLLLHDLCNDPSWP